MVKAIIDITNEANRVVNIIKAKYGFRDKSEALNLIVSEFGENLLEPTLRPAFVSEIKRIEKGKFRKVRRPEELFKQ